MATSPPQSDPEIPGFPESVRLLLASAAGYLHARLQLLGLEFKDAGINYVKILILLVMSVVFLIFGYIFFVMALAYLVAWVCHGRWGWVTLGFGFGHIALAAACLWIAKSRFGVSSFASTIAELKKDKEWLSQTKATTTRSQNLSVVRTN
jgi:uncharacterized membrane protein YqjE